MSLLRSTLGYVAKKATEGPRFEIVDQPIILVPMPVRAAHAVELAFGELGMPRHGHTPLASAMCFLLTPSTNIIKTLCLNPTASPVRQARQRTTTIHSSLTPATV